MKKIKYEDGKPVCPICGNTLEDVGCYKWDCLNDCLPEAMEIQQIENFANVAQGNF